MQENVLRDFGKLITRLMQRSGLRRDESKEAWRQILEGAQPDLQQGAFMAALAMKGETSEEIAGCYEAIYELDTEKVDLAGIPRLLENSGTGRDTLKTFNISTAAAVVAAANQVAMARHGARALTSRCGTVDVLEHVGIDVECDGNVVKQSIEKVGIGLFNGMSAKVHPGGLFRILSQIRFGSTLHIAASLANPARPVRAVRGVFSADMIDTTARTMREIGFEKALICFGWNSDRSAGMDEVSTLGETEIAEIDERGIERYQVAPEDFGIKRTRLEAISEPDNVHQSAKVLVGVLSGKGAPEQEDIVCLNAAPILKVAGISATLKQGFEAAKETIATGKAAAKLREWVHCQNLSPSMGMAKLRAIEALC
jgi:anthranilate phosphoribosyltransferase